MELSAIAELKAQLKEEKEKVRYLTGRCEDLLSVINQARGIGEAILEELSPSKKGQQHILEKDEIEFLTKLVEAGECTDANLNYLMELYAALSGLEQYYEQWGPRSDKERVAAAERLIELSNWYGQKRGG